MTRLLVLFLLALPAVAAEDAPRVLIPIVATLTPGAYDVFWYTEISARNQSDQLAYVIVPTGASLAGLPHPFFYSLPPATTVRLDPARTENVGVVAFLQPGSAHDVVIQERGIAEADGGCQSAGVQIPTAREDEFRTRLSLINIPSDDRYRVLVRIYSLTTHPLVARAHVTADFGPTPAPADYVVPVSAAFTRTDFASTRAMVPGYGALPLPTHASRDERISIEINADEPVWALQASPTTRHRR